MLVTLLLENYISSFLGFGNFHADIWFIGMEQGGGGTYEDLYRRLSAWENRGKRVLEDVRDYHYAIGIEKFFREPVFLQRTWGHLIRIFLSMNSKPVDLPNIKDFQKNLFAREEGSTCIMELMPLPSPSTAKWLYSQWSILDYLRTRESYFRRVLPDRIKLIRSKIDTYKPPFVVFYGLTYIDHFERVIGARFQFNEEYDCYWYEKSGITYLAIKHPVARGVDNQYFIKIGKLLKSQKHICEVESYEEQIPLIIDDAGGTMIEKADELVEAGQSAVVFFTKGPHFIYDANGDGTTGNWTTGAGTLERMDKVIIYRRGASVKDNRIFIGDYMGWTQSPEEKRLIIQFSRLKEIGKSTSNWVKFGGSRGGQPFFYVYN